MPPDDISEARADRARAVVDAYAAAGCLAVVQTRHGVVRIAAVTLESEDGYPYVGVRLHPDPGRECDYRIFNPPLLVTDPDGDIITPGGRYRRDPVLAVAEVIGSLGAGATSRRRRR
jgi:hypothetical protein